MPIDLNRFIGTFFDEAQEHLESIEEKAMSLASGRYDPELLNSIFRAAHSIKGGSGTFGFMQLSDATHEMETLFDQLRKGKRHPDASTVRLLLDACDVFKAHIARLKAGSRDTDPAMDAVRAKIAEYRGADPAGEAQQPAPATAVAVAPGSAASESFFIAPAAATEFGLFAEDREEALDAEPAPVRAIAPSATQEKFGFFEAPAGEAQPGAAGTAAVRELNRPRSAEQSSIRVSTEKIDRIVNLVGELVIAQAMLQQAAGKVVAQQDERLAHSLGALDRHTRDLQQAVMSIRMMPMEFVFSRFPRLVYDVSTRLGRKVHLRTQGHETELDKEMIELLIDPLTHVVRNAIDHGIESPEERVASGKPEMGTVSMRATHRGGSVIIEVADDGRGLDRDRLLAKARELGMPCDDAWSDTEVFGLIFEAGFSTATQVTDLSGRGVGMDVVRRNISSLGGHVSISSESGAGTTITIKLPLTLAVLDGMVVSVANEQYIVPLEFVAEAIQPKAADIRSVANTASLVAVRGEHLPLIRLEDVVGLPARSTPRTEADLCLVVEVDDRRAALLVDSLIGQQQLVVKSLDTNLHAVAGIAGATILGDGQVALILDVTSLVRERRPVAERRMTDNPVGLAAVTREFAFSGEHFRVISERIYAFSGIRLPEAKREMVYARLARRLRSLGISSFDDYLRFLELEPAEWEHCTNALTTNVTAFYRESHHFDILAGHARSLQAEGEPLRVWSAGCSSGEEPYTIAMCLTEALPGGRFEVLATDLDTQVLAAATEGVYPLQSVQALTEERQKRFFLRGAGRMEGKARVRRELATHVEFRRLNLMDREWPVSGAFDAIFCRNVMIYFDKPTQRRLIERFWALLKPKGLFFAGHAESLLDNGRHFTLRGQTVYQRVNGFAGRVA